MTQAVQALDVSGLGETITSARRWSDRSPSDRSTDTTDAKLVAVQTWVLTVVGAPYSAELYPLHKLREDSVRRSLPPVTHCGGLFAAPSLGSLRGRGHTASTTMPLPL